jgi:Restriction endonuclease
MTKSRARSRYDELHDRFDPIKTGKAGTRYERLAAMVLKALNQRDIVVHDIRLRGDSDVKHQIDVRVERNGTERRIIVECKDFDLAGDKVGLDIVRSFRSVLEDTGADEALILTCNDFTRDARKYAKAKGIKLALLRAFKPTDMDGRIQKIIHTIHVRGITDLSVDLMGLAEDENDRFAVELSAAGLTQGFTPATPVAFVKGTERVQFNQFLKNAADADVEERALSDGEHRMTIMPDGWQISVDSGAGIDFVGIALRYTFVDVSETYEITSNRIAEMILADLDGTDLVIFADQLERHQIGPDGTVS